MKITREHLRRFAKTLLQTLDREDIHTIKDLKRMVNQTLSIPDTENFISFSLNPSNQGTLAYTTSYVTSQSGIPIEIKTNKSLGYQKIIIKTLRQIPGYTPFARPDPYNLAQEKKILSSDFSLARQELQRLTSI